MTKKILLFLIMLIVIIIPLAGCWNYVEVDKLALVTGIAIDKGPSENTINLTAETVDLGSGGKDAVISADIAETTGETISDAIGNAMSISGKRLYMEHCQIVIISKELAQEGIDPLLDYLLRDHEPRLELNVVISNGKTAKEILTQKALSSPLKALEINDEIDSDKRDLSKTRFIELYQVFDDLESNGIALTLPLIENVPNNGSLLSSLTGTAIFKNDKMIGTIDGNDSQLLNFALNEVTGGSEIVVDQTNKPIVDLEIFKNTTDTVPDYSGNKIKLTINNIVSVAIDETKVKTDFFSQEGTKKLENMAEEQLNNKIGNFVKKIQEEYGVDIFGFGNLIHQTNPKLWEKIEPKWDQIFKTLDVTVKTKINIRSSFVIKQPIKKGG